MSRRKLKRFGALLALTSLLVLNLHVLAHIFGQDHDGDQGTAPCALCQTVLAQHSVAAAPSVEPPHRPLGFLVSRPEPSPVREPLFTVAYSTRGPPRPAFLSA